MTTPAARTVPIVLVRRDDGDRDAYNNPQPTISVKVVHGVFAPGGSSEDTDSRDQVVTKPTVYLPAADLSSVDAVVTGASVTADDSVVVDGTGWPVDGLRWEIDGDPILWPPNPFTGKSRPRPLEVHLTGARG